MILILTKCCYSQQNLEIGQVAWACPSQRQRGREEGPIIFSFFSGVWIVRYVQEILDQNLMTVSDDQVDLNASSTFD